MVSITIVFHRGNLTLHLAINKVRQKLLLHQNLALNAILKAHQVIKKLADKTVVLIMVC